MRICCVENIPRLFVGFSAMAISLLLLFQKSSSLLITVAVIYLLAICAIDTFLSKIPNFCNLALLLAGLIYNFHQAGLAGLFDSLAGLVVGMSLLLIPYFLGGMGGGDVKAMAALGALLGPMAIFQMFLYVGLAGGLLAVLHYLFQGNLFQKVSGTGRALLVFAGTQDSQCIRPAASEKLRFPYAAAISIGFCCYASYGEILPFLETLISGQV